MGGWSLVGGNIVNVACGSTARVWSQSVMSVAAEAAMARITAKRWAHFHNPLVRGPPEVMSRDPPTLLPWVIRVPLRILLSHVTA